MEDNVSEEQGPQTVGEWLSYINLLEGEEFTNKAFAFNTPNFIQHLRDEEGYSAEEISMILNGFANRFVQLGMVLPRRMRGQYCSYAGVFDTFSKYDLPFTPEEAEARNREE